MGNREDRCRGVSADLVPRLLFDCTADFSEQRSHTSQHRARVVEKVGRGEALIEKLFSDLRGEFGIGMMRASRICGKITLLAH